MCFVRILAQWPLSKYSRHLPETHKELHPQKETIPYALTPGSLSHYHTNINKWRAITWQDLTFSRQGSTGAIIVGHKLVHLNGDERASSTTHLTIDNVPGAPPPDDTPDEKTINHQKLDLTCIPNSINTLAHRQVAGVEYAVGKAYGKATGLYNKHRKYSEQWNPWHPCRSSHDLQLAESFTQQTKMWIHQHLRHGLDDLNMKSCLSEDPLSELHSRLNIELGDDCSIEDFSHIFGTWYYRDIFKCTHPLCHISRFLCNSIVTHWAIPTQKVAEYTVR